VLSVYQSPIKSKFGSFIRLEPVSVVSVIEPLPTLIIVFELSFCTSNDDDKELSNMSSLYIAVSFIVHPAILPSDELNIP